MSAEKESTEKEIVGYVTREESQMAQKICLHRYTLQELKPVLPAEPELHEKFDRDWERTQTAFSSWWDGMAAKYAWPTEPESTFLLDFKTGEVTRKVQ